MHAAELSSPSSSPAAGQTLGDRAQLLNRLQAEVGAGGLSAAILDNWRSIDAWLNDTPDALAGLLSAAAELDPGVGSAQSAAAKSIAVALVGARGQLRAADGRFTAWVGDPAASIACMRLLRLALEGRPAVGLVETADHGVLTVLAAAGSAMERWRSASGLTAASEDGAAAALVAFAPSRSDEVVAEAARAYGLSPLESRLTAALVDAPTLELAAQAIGVGRETAKEAMSGALRKVGVATAAQLVARVVGLSCSNPEDTRDGSERIGAALGLSPTEARVARELGRGASAKATASFLSLSPQTVATYRRTIFAKTGVNRTRDLGRLLTEVEGLERLASASEIVLDAPDARERLRAVIDKDGRRIAFVDYGPASGRPLVLGHSTTNGRTCPPPLLAALHRQGRRVIAVQRPGFGLTAPSRSEHLQTVSEDLVLVLDELGIGRTDLLTRSSLTGLEFAARRPERLGRMLLVNPQPPGGRTQAPHSPLSLASRILLDQPVLIERFGRMLSLQSRSDLVAALVRKTASEVVADQAVVETSALLQHMVRDMQGLLGVGVVGFAAEQRLMATGWTPPAVVTGANVTVVQGGALRNLAPAEAWPTLAEARFVRVKGGGWFLHYSHPDALLAELER